MKILDMLINWIVLIVKAVVFLFILPVYWTIPMKWGSKYIDCPWFRHPDRTADDIHLNYTLVIKLIFWILLWGFGPPLLLIYLTSRPEWILLELLTIPVALWSMIQAYAKGIS